MKKAAKGREEELASATGEGVSDPETGAEGSAIVFDNALLFSLNSSTLRSGVRADLADLAASLRSYSGHDAVVIGHASSDSPSDPNQPLSDNRAAPVSSSLVSLGIDPYRPAPVWYWMPGQKPTEVSMLKCYDSVTDGSVSRWSFHSACFDPTAPDDAPCRKNVVVRSYVFF